MSGVKFVCVSVLWPGLPGAPASTHAPRSISNLTQATRPSRFFLPSDLQTCCKGVRQNPSPLPPALQTWSTLTPADRSSRNASTSQSRAAEKSAVKSHPPSSDISAVLTLLTLDSKGRLRCRRKRRYERMDGESAALLDAHRYRPAAAWG